MNQQDLEVMERELAEGLKRCQDAASRACAARTVQHETGIGFLVALAKPDLHEETRKAARAVNRDAMNRYEEAKAALEVADRDFADLALKWTSRVTIGR